MELYNILSFLLLFLLEIILFTGVKPQFVCVLRLISSKTLSLHLEQGQEIRVETAKAIPDPEPCYAEAFFRTFLSNFYLFC